MENFTKYRQGLQLDQFNNISDQLSESFISSKTFSRDDQRSQNSMQIDFVMDKMLQNSENIERDSDILKTVEETKSLEFQLFEQEYMYNGARSIQKQQNRKSEQKSDNYKSLSISKIIDMASVNE